MKKILSLLFAAALSIYASESSDDFKRLESKLDQYNKTVKIVAKTYDFLKLGDLKEPLPAKFKYIDGDIYKVFNVYKPAANLVDDMKLVKKDIEITNTNVNKTVSLLNALSVENTKIQKVSFDNSTNINSLSRKLDELLLKVNQIATNQSGLEKRLKELASESKESNKNTESK